MANDLIPEASYMAVELPEWKIVAHWVVADDGGKYIAIRAQCHELGISPERQIQKLTDPDGDYPEEAVREFRIQTAGGWKVTRCVRKAEAAHWIGSLKPQRVREDLREHLAEVKARILMAADRIVWGDMTDVRAVATIQPRGGELHLGGCPKCRTELGARFGPQGLELFIA